MAPMAMDTPGGPLQRLQEKANAQAKAKAFASAKAEAEEAAKAPREFRSGWFPSGFHKWGETHG